VVSRSATRAFEGAPPRIPHPIGQNSSATCSQCHEKTTIIGAVIAPIYSHKHLLLCLQCHVEGVSAIPSKNDTIAPWGSTFVGLRGPSSPYRWNGFSPPSIPHHVFMRERCRSCHGEHTNQIEFRSPHVERQSCQQCHAGSALVDDIP